MDISRMAGAAAIAAGVGLSALSFGIGPVNGVPLDPPPPSPAPGGPAMSPATSSPATTALPFPGTGPAGPHGGQGATQMPTP